MLRIAFPTRSSRNHLLLNAPHPILSESACQLMHERVLRIKVRSRRATGWAIIDACVRFHLA